MQLPEALKPTEKYNNKRQLLFEKLNSTWGVDTATDNMGRSRTINFLHASECAFWRKGISTIQAGLGEALTKDSIKIYESTANGFNDFREMWKSGNHVNCFYEWWKTLEYRTNFQDEKVQEEFINNINTKKEWIWQRLKWLKETKEIEDKQLFWYYNKYLNYIDKELIKQEYPCTEDEAFISSGQCIFDKENIIRRISELKEPLKTGYFTYATEYKEENNEILINNKSITWVDDINGYIKIYEDVKRGHPYVLAGDTAEDGNDNFAGQVIDNATGKQVAVLKHKFDEDMYAKQMYCLGIYYNAALLGPEINFSTYPIKKLEEFKYPNLYIREKEDDYTHNKVKSYGFKTTSLTRPIIIAELVVIFRDHIDSINDKDTLEEALTFIRNEKGRPEAQYGAHDDLIMALAIAYYIRVWQETKIKIEEKKIELPHELETENIDESEYVNW